MVVVVVVVVSKRFRKEWIDKLNSLISFFDFYQIQFQIDIVNSLMIWIMRKLINKVDNTTKNEFVILDFNVYVYEWFIQDIEISI